MITAKLAPLAVLAFAADGAFAQIDYISDSRVVDASSQMTLADPGGGDPQVLSRDFSDMPDPLFAPFEASRLALLLGPDGNTTTSLAVQDSSMIGGVLTASGFVETQVDLPSVAPGSSGVADAVSEYRVGFSYGPGVYYIVRISGTVTKESPDDGAQTSSEAIVGIALGGVSDHPGRYRTRVFPANGSVSFSDRVMLGPGKYEYIARAASSATAESGNPGQSEASFEATFEVIGRPCSFADLAEPYFQLDLEDIREYVEGYQNQDPIVDYEEPYGVLDLAEIGSFITSFLAGCP